MVKVYENGQDFLKDNKAYLDTDVNLSCFFYIDAPLLTKTDNINYCLKIEKNNFKLLALKLEPYNILIFGDKECALEFVDFIMENHYEIKNIFAEKSLAEKIVHALANYNISYTESITMDFMVCNQITIPSSDFVEIPSTLDVDTLYQYMEDFLVECGLLDKITKDNVRKDLSSYRIIRYNGEIAAMAKFGAPYDKYGRIGYVYTLPKYRNKGFAKQLVNTVKNELLENGYIATLNVDRKNPISNHVYASIGFEITFAQSIFVCNDKN